LKLFYFYFVLFDKHKDNVYVKNLLYRNPERTRVTYYQIKVYMQYVHTFAENIALVLKGPYCIDADQL